MTILALPPALANVSIPKQVKVVPVTQFENLMSEVGRRSMAVYGSNPAYGVAFVQGGRLQFTCAMSFDEVLSLSHPDVARKRDGVEDIVRHANRPTESAQSKRLYDYLISTACVGEKFILPAVSLNYGVDLPDDLPDAALIILVDGRSPNVWLAIFLLPKDARLDITDGVHRLTQIDEILRFADEEQREELRLNAVDVKIVFESSRDAAHQDFADCAKAKSIAKSIITTYDVRDLVNKRTRELVENVPFLTAYVDATADNVNLSSKSLKIWSMSAVKGCITHLRDHHPHKTWTLDEKTENLEKMINELVKYVPVLKALDTARNYPSPAVTPGTYREQAGGNILLRAVGMSLVAWAYAHCIEHKIKFEYMAKRLACLDWNVLLKITRQDFLQKFEDQQKIDPSANPGELMLQYGNRLWFDLLVFRGNNYRIKSGKDEASSTWLKIVEAITAMSDAYVSEMLNPKAAA